MYWYDVWPRCLLPSNAEQRIYSKNGKYKVAAQKLAILVIHYRNCGGVSDSGKHSPLALMLLLEHLVYLVLGKQMIVHLLHADRRLGLISPV